MAKQWEESRGFRKEMDLTRPQKTPGQKSGRWGTDGDGMGLSGGDGTFLASGLAEKINRGARNGNGEDKTNNGKNGHAQNQGKPDGEKRQNRTDNKMIGFILKTFSIQHVNLPMVGLRIPLYSLLQRNLMVAMELSRIFFGKTKKQGRHNE